MSISQTQEQATETALQEKAELEARVKYLQTQLGQFLEEKRRMMRSSRSPLGEPLRREAREEESFHSDSSNEDEESRRATRTRREDNLDFKVDIPSFEGQLDPDLFLDWLRTVERVFDFKDVPEEKKVKLVAIKLRKYASIWWANLVAKRAKKGKPKIRTWEKMKSKLKEKFLPNHYLQDNYLKLHSLKQGNKSVEEYTREFEQLLLKCDLQEDETQTLIRYLSGLDEQIAHVVDLHPYSSLDDLSSLAYKVEQQRKSKGKAPLSKPPISSYPLQRTPNTLPSPQNNPPPRPNPPRPNPLTVQNTSEKAPPKPDTRRRCYKCQGLGHIAAECPNQRIITLAEYQASFEEVEKEEGGEEKEVFLNEPLEEVEVGPDEGELLVIRRALSGLASQEEFEQREAIFRTRCTIEGKVCSLIIDGGSCTNVASQTMVEKLKLVTTPHPSPYTIQWLHQGKGLRVSSHCLVSFSIGKNYTDEVWCDILPMDASHVLLGRPWLFDRGVMLDGRLNTYSFTKDHKRITLTPLKSNPPKKPHNIPNKGVLLTTWPHAQPHDLEDYQDWKPLAHKPIQAKGSSHPLLVLPPKPFTKPRANKPRKRAHFQPGDLVWVELRKETFPNKRKSKRISISDGPFEVLERSGPNAYKVDLSGDCGISATFNVADLSPYVEEDEDPPSLRTNSKQPGEYDGDHPTQVTKDLSHDPKLFYQSKESKEIQPNVRKWPRTTRQ